MTALDAFTAEEPTDRKPREKPDERAYWMFEWQTLPLLALAALGVQTFAFWMVVGASFRPNA